MDQNKLRALAGIISEQKSTTTPKIVNDFLGGKMAHNMINVHMIFDRDELKDFLMDFYNAGLKAGENKAKGK